MVQIALKVSHLTVKYGIYAALKKADLVIYKDEIMSIVGPNGAGKTTLLETIAGLRKVREGEISYMDKSINGVPVFQRRKMGIVLIPQDDNVFPNMSVKMNLDVSGILKGATTIKEEGERLLSMILEVASGKVTKADMLHYNETMDIYTIGPVIRIPASILSSISRFATVEITKRSTYL